MIKILFSIMEKKNINDIKNIFIYNKNIFYI